MLAPRQFSSILPQLITHVRTPLYANAYALILNQVAGAGLGVLYWLLAARLYSAEVVGQNSAVISTILFLAALSELSLYSAMTRFVPRAGRRTSRLLFSAYGINLVTAVLISLVFLTVGNRFQFTAGLFSDTHLPAGWVVAATAVWCIFYVQGGVLTGMRQAVWVLIENQLYNIAKIVLLIAGVWVFYDYGIAASWFLPTPLIVLLVNLLIFWRFMPRHVAAMSAQATRITPRQVITSVTGDHIGSLFAETCVRMLPLMVLNLRGKSASAYFYQAWMIASLLYLVASNMTHSFTVEAAANMRRTTLYSRRILRQMVCLILPVAAAILVAAPLGLSLFGAAYAREGTVLLRCLALAALPVILNTWYLSYARVMGNVKTIILIQSLLSVPTLGLSYWWLPRYGINGIGFAWLVTHSLVAGLVVVRAAPMLLNKDAHHDTNQVATLNQILRRADWRFLSSVPQPHKSVCFAEGLLAQAVAKISGQVVDGRAASGSECDLAVAVNPNQSTLHAAHAALHPEGACYTEWAAWRAGGAAGIRRKLQSAGFGQVKFYWPYPTPVASRLWLPVQTSIAPYRYLVSRVMAGDGILPRMARAVLPGIVRMALRLGFVPCLCTIAYKDGSHCRDVFEFTCAEWSRASAEPSAASLSFLVQTGGSQLSNKIICLAFEGPDLQPQWAVKLPRVSEDAQTLQHEQDILNELYHASSTSSVMLLPRMLFSGEVNGVWTSAQTALTGVSINSLVRRDNWREIALQLTDWQITLAQQSRARLRAATSAQVIERLVANLDELSGKVLEPGALTRTRGILSGLDAVPLVCAHNDFAPWNVVQTQGGLGVFDWTDADLTSLPMLDLVYGLANLTFALKDARDEPSMLATYQMLTDPGTAVGSVFEECLKRYAEQVGLQLNQIAPLRLLTWILHSNFEYQYFIAEHGSQAPIDQLRGSVYISLWTSELRFNPAPVPAKSVG